MIIFIYLVYVFLIVRFSVTVFNFISNPKLPATPVKYRDFVSILIPARNEENSIFRLLNSIHEQDYENYEVIVLDDNSTDSTSDIVQQYIEDKPKFKFIQGEKLPHDWLGKNYACYQLANKAKGDFYLFLDADVEIGKGLINHALHRMRINGLSLLSLFPDQKTFTLGEKIVVPLMNWILISLLPIRLVLLSKYPSLSAACGQFMLFRAEQYDVFQWHEKVKEEIVEDIAIMKEVKRTTFRGEVLLGNGFIACRMYESLKQSVQGFGKNILAGFSYNFFALLGFIFLVFFGYAAVFNVLSLQLVVLSISLTIGIRFMVASLSNQSFLQNLLLHPLQMIMLVVISAISIQKYLTNTIVWKGRQISKK